MIEGLKLDIDAEELKTHLVNHAIIHKDKAAAYSEKRGLVASALSKVEAALADAAPDKKFSNSTSKDAVQDLDTKVKEHLRAADLFQFMAKHLVPNETYRLSESELERLEFIPSRY